MGNRRELAAFCAAAALSACKIDAATFTPPDGDGPGDASGLAECKAQRVVHLVGGRGGLAWFTLAWPSPSMITGFQPGFAYDDPGNAKDVTSDPGHPLFARRTGTRAIWEGLGKEPQPSVFVAGSNESHTLQPGSILLGGGVALAAGGAAIQATLAPRLAVLQFSPGGPYGQAPGAPSSVSVADVEGAIGQFQGMITPQVEQQLRPSAAQLARYVSSNAVQVEIDLGTRLAFTANAFRFGLLGTVIMQAVNDDPHTAFSSGPPTQRANNLAAMLDAFYSDLATSSEMTCGQGGNALSLADNVVLIVTGDTPKNSFDNANWPDVTPGGANLMYVRSNGFTRPGWFGEIRPTGRLNFDPTTGALDPMASAASSTKAAVAGALYAIARGDKARVQSFTDAPFDGVIRP